MSSCFPEISQYPYHGVMPLAKVSLDAFYSSNQLQKNCDRLHKPAKTIPLPHQSMLLADSLRKEGYEHQILNMHPFSVMRLDGWYSHLISLFFSSSSQMRRSRFTASSTRFWMMSSMMSAKGRLKGWLANLSHSFVSQNSKVPPFK